MAAASCSQVCHRSVLVDLYTGQGGRYGSRDAAASASGAAVEAGQRGGAANSLYNRLSLGDSSGGEERTAVESGTNSNDSLEMSRVKPKRSAPPTYEPRESNHVLFGDEDHDPFDDSAR